MQQEVVAVQRLVWIFLHVSLSVSHLLVSCLPAFVSPSLLLLHSQLSLQLLNVET